MKNKTYKLYVGRSEISEIYANSDIKAKRIARKILKEMSTIISQENNKNIDVY